MLEIKNWIAFRFDSSTSIGSGHAFRCIRLIRTLQKRSINIVVVSNVQLPEVVSELEKHSCTLLWLDELKDPTNPGSEKMVASSSVQATINPNQCQDADITLNLLKAEVGRRDGKLIFVVVDHYELGREWEFVVGKISPIFVIDDLSNRLHDASWILDPSGLRSALAEENRIEKSPHFFHPPKYHLLDDFGGDVRKRDRESDNCIRLLINFGSSDQTEYILSTLNCIRHVPDSIRVGLSIIYGASDANKLQKALDMVPSNINITNSLPYKTDLPAYQRGFDLCIGAWGVSSLERLAGNIPSINTVVVDNQKKIASYYRNHFSVMDLSPGAFECELMQIFSVLSNDWIRSKFSGGLDVSFFDNDGLENVANILEGVS